MFMDYHGVFTSIVERKEDKYAFWSLFISCEIDYGFGKESSKFNELVGFYCVQSI